MELGLWELEELLLTLLEEELGEDEELLFWLLELLWLLRLLVLVLELLWLLRLLVLVLELLLRLLVLVLLELLGLELLLLLRLLDVLLLDDDNSSIDKICSLFT